MKTPSIAFGLALSILAGLSSAGNAMPKPPLLSADLLIVQVQTGGRVIRREDDRRDDRNRQHRQHHHPRAGYSDCHRDVRTHRIYGAWVTHRHVGKNCTVREVRRSTVPAPGQN